MNPKGNIYILNTIFVGTETINSIRKEINIKGIIGLNENFEDENIISGFADMKTYCEKNNINFIGLDSYSLKSEKDKEKLLNLDIDILLVLGWQRLIPDWFINNVKIACIGVHGSPWGIEKGRGRSPINWSLILGQKKFIVDIFKINPGIDSGDIIDEDELIINEFDDVNSIYYKISWIISRLIVKNIRNGNIFKGNFTKQEDGEAKYLPKRTPEDGQIDWNRTNMEIYNFIRALTKPYPGAFSYINNSKVLIWKAIPFEQMKGMEKYKPGEIIKFYSSHNEFLVKCRIGAILVKEYSCETNICQEIEGIQFSTCSFKEQLKSILNRHYSVYKNNECNEEIENIIIK